jgi:hypothetical protein
MIFFCDPYDTGSPCATNTNCQYPAVANSGNAFDRENIDIGLTTKLLSANTARLCVDPANSVNAIQLFYLPSGIAGFVSDNPSNASQGLTLTSASAGETVLVSPGFSNPTVLPPLLANPNWDQLGTYVFPPFPAGAPLPISFWILTDTTTLGYSTDQLSALIAGAASSLSLNGIWSQGYVSFQQFGTVGTFSVGVSVSPLAEADIASISQTLPFGGQNGFFLNVYFVPSLSPSIPLPSDQFLVGDTPPTPNCTGAPSSGIFGQSFVATHFSEGGDLLTLDQLAQSVAHEVGHQLGLDSSLQYAGHNLGADIDSTDATAAYLLMSHGGGRTITPLQRDCLSSVRGF